MMKEHDGQNCENCIHRGKCLPFLQGYALWCMYWDGGEDEANR